MTGTSPRDGPTLGDVRNDEPRSAFAPLYAHAPLLIANGITSKHPNRLENLMLSKSALDFILKITDYFHGHYEDPEWGRMPATQILVAVAVRDMAAGINDKELRTQITSAADKVVAMNSQAVLRT